jgi:hypothetical protein
MLFLRVRAAPACCLSTNIEETDAQKNALHTKPFSLLQQHQKTKNRDRRMDEVAAARLRFALQDAEQRALALATEKRALEEELNAARQVCFFEKEGGGGVVCAGRRARLARC